MKYIDEFADKEAAVKICQRLARRLGRREARFMEVCGTHTMAAFRSGIRALLPANVSLLSGPGCPVCVTPNEYIDRAIALSRLPDVTVCTFGDMFRVPGSSSSLERAKAQGADVRMVYSPLKSVEIARDNPGRRVIFLAVGFETTAPTVAATITIAAGEGLENLFFLVGHKLIPPAMEALLESGGVRVDGFLCPGHVSTVIGARAYHPLVERYGIPCVIAGFEPLDILLAIEMLVHQVLDGSAHVAVEYTRVVRVDGNARARSAMERVFEPCDSVWRGLGEIPKSGLWLREEYAFMDAEKEIPVEVEPTREHPDCLCGEVLKATAQPDQCPLFGSACTPESPVGPCMVSSEGTCAAYYKYGQQATGNGQ